MGVLDEGSTTRDGKDWVHSENVVKWSQHDCWQMEYRWWEKERDQGWGKYFGLEQPEGRWCCFWDEGVYGRNRGRGWPWTSGVWSGACWADMLMSYSNEEVRKARGCVVVEVIWRIRKMMVVRAVKIECLLLECMNTIKNILFHVSAFRTKWYIETKAVQLEN